MATPSTFRFELVSPDRLLADSKVAAVSVPGAEGDFVVLPRHAPLMTTLRPGILTVSEDQRDPQRIFIRGGFAEVTPQGLVVLAEEAIAVQDLSADDLKRRVAFAEEDAKHAKTDEERRHAQEALARLGELLQAVS